MDHIFPLGVAALIAVAIIATFNHVIGKKNQVEFAFASIDAQLKKRYDLIPNLISTCEKYMGYENQLLQGLAETRKTMVQASPDEQVTLDRQLTSGLRSVFALAEQYPDLKAIDSFNLLQRSLNEVEEQLAAARRAFNAAVTAYNDAVQMFPTSLAAKVMGYRTRTWFEASAEEREPVKVWRS